MDIDVKIGEAAVAKERDMLRASGVGSCVVITLYHPRLRIGAMAHSMLPISRSSFVNRESKNEKRATRYESRNARYVSTAIDEMLKRLEAQGGNRKDLEAKIVGGANVFSSFDSDIGTNNIEAAEEKLKKEGIKIVGECVGGSQGRSVEFSLGSGIVVVKTKF